MRNLPLCSSSPCFLLPALVDPFPYMHHITANTPYQMKSNEDMIISFKYPIVAHKNSEHAMAPT